MECLEWEPGSDCGSELAQRRSRKRMEWGFWDFGGRPALRSGPEEEEAGKWWELDGMAPRPSFGGCSAWRQWWGAGKVEDWGPWSREVLGAGNGGIGRLERESERKGAEGVG